MKNWLIFLMLFTALVACKQTASDVVSHVEEAKYQTTSNVEQPKNSALIEAFQGKKSNLFVEGSGVVKKLLPEDNKGSRHQKFLVTISDEQTLLFAHNIDLSKSIPLVVGDTIEFRGEYVYNPKGGVMHWTHHDPQAKIEGGWIKHNGQIYQ